MKEINVFSLAEEHFVIVTKTHVLTNITLAEKDAYIQEADSIADTEIEPAEGWKIATAGIASVSCADDDSVINIRFKTGVRMVTEELCMKSEGERERLFNCLYEQSRDEFEYKTRHESAFKSVLAPLGMLVFILVVGGGVTWLAQMAQGPVDKSFLAHRYAKLLYLVLHSVDPVIPMGLTGMFAAICGGYLLFRMKRPSKIITIEKKAA